MAVAGERACYHSMVSFGNQVVLLGTKALQVLTVRTWHERLDQLYASGQLLGCLQLARQMVGGKATAVVGLHHRRSKRKQELANKVQEITEKILDSWWVEQESAPRNYGDLLVPEMVNVCVESRLQLLLLGRVWQVLQDDDINKGVFLESLEPHILSRAISCLPPATSQELLAHYETAGKLAPLEQCIVHLEVTSLDLHQTITMGWSHGLYDVIIYVYTKGMRDYVTPLEELTTVLSSALDTTCGCSVSSTHKEKAAQESTLPPAMVSLGNKLLVYISCCLAGRGYPSGDIESELLSQVKYEVFKCLSSVHSKNAQETQKPFPYLRTLLRFSNI